MCIISNIMHAITHAASFVVCLALVQDNITLCSMSVYCYIVGRALTGRTTTWSLLTSTWILENCWKVTLIEVPLHTSIIRQRNGPSTWVKNSIIEWMKKTTIELAPTDTNINGFNDDRVCPCRQCQSNVLSLFKVGWSYNLGSVHSGDARCLRPVYP